MRERRRRMALAAGAGLVAVALLVGWLLWPRVEATPERPPDAPAAAPVSDPEVSAPQRRGACDGGARRGFEPASLSIAGVVRGAPVVGVPRDDRGVPGVLPVAQKRDFAWDLDGVEPGSPHGQVLLNTHTWPDGSAMGNHLLAELGVGDELMVRGRGRHLCYRVTEQVEVKVEDGYEGYGRTDGPPVLVLLVCSGERRGPGDWSHRTLWFAEPVR